MHIIVFGNEKGGTGKSTTAMHVVASLLGAGLRVAALDLDHRQRTLTRYLENRVAYRDDHGLDLGLPEHLVIPGSGRSHRGAGEREDRERLATALERLRSAGYGFAVIDCPGSDTRLARLAHALADTLVTPLNDSFVDLDLLGQVSPDTYRVERLSLYSEAVWDSRKQRALSGRRSLDWVVMRNRTSSVDARNKRRVHQALTQLQDRVAFRYVAGLTERVIYRELFPKGLTLADLRLVPRWGRFTMSHIAARQELRMLMDDLRLPGWGEREAA